MNGPSPTRGRRFPVETPTSNRSESPTHRADASDLPRGAGAAMLRQSGTALAGLFGPAGRWAQASSSAVSSLGGFSSSTEQGAAAGGVGTRRGRGGGGGLPARTLQPVQGRFGTCRDRHRASRCRRRVQDQPDRGVDQRGCCACRCQGAPSGLRRATALQGWCGAGGCPAGQADRHTPTHTARAEAAAAGHGPEQPQPAAGWQPSLRAARHDAVGRAADDGDVHG